MKGSLVFALLHGFVSGSFDYSETGYGGHNVQKLSIGEIYLNSIYYSMCSFCVKLMLKVYFKIQTT